jgi:hypothetical protein
LIRKEKNEKNKNHFFDDTNKYEECGYHISSKHLKNKINEKTKPIKRYHLYIYNLSFPNIYIDIYHYQ